VAGLDRGGAIDSVLEPFDIAGDANPLVQPGHGPFVDDIGRIGNLDRELQLMGNQRNLVEERGPAINPHSQVAPSGHV
jgi:hypothetical protein